jgi:hypothetical protein
MIGIDANAQQIAIATPGPLGSNKGATAQIYLCQIVDTALVVSWSIIPWCLWATAAMM